MSLANLMPALTILSTLDPTHNLALCVGRG